jgi:branched-chain amino acid transport system ATP-binding protein
VRVDATAAAPAVEPAHDDALLTLDALVTGYGSVPVLHGVGLAVPDRAIAVILGANGVGKTTTLRAVSGLLPAWRGRVAFAGHGLQHIPAEQRVRLGIGTVPAAPAVFRDLTVLDNLRVGAITDRRRAHTAARIEEVLDVFPALRSRAKQLAGSLSGGEQRMLAIARALMSRPRLLLVDEASMGLSPVMVLNVLGLLDSLRSSGLAICMVEQNVAALDVADRAYLMEQGRVVHAAVGSDVASLRDEAARVYLGAAPAARRRT